MIIVGRWIMLSNDTNKLAKEHTKFVEACIKT
jgi:hypothetical protein